MTRLLFWACALFTLGVREMSATSSGCLEFEGESYAKIVGRKYGLGLCEEQAAMFLHALQASDIVMKDDSDVDAPRIKHSAFSRDEIGAFRSWLWLLANPRMDRRERVARFVYMNRRFAPRSDAADDDITAQIFWRCADISSAELKSDLMGCRGLLREALEGEDMKFSPNRFQQIVQSLPCEQNLGHLSKWMEGGVNMCDTALLCDVSNLTALLAYLRCILQGNSVLGSWRVYVVHMWVWPSIRPLCPENMMTKKLWLDNVFGEDTALQYIKCVAEVVEAPRAFSACELADRYDNLFEGRQHLKDKARDVGLAVRSILEEIPFSIN